jgi:hypothetical protein
VTRSKNERVSTRYKRINRDVFAVNKMVVTVWGEYSDNRIGEIPPRADRTNLSTHPDAPAEHGFATDPELKGHGCVPAAGDTAGSKEHVTV